MIKLSYILFSMLVLNSCYNNHSSTESTKSISKRNETLASPGISGTDFTSVCSHDEVKPMSIKYDLIVWGFNPLSSDKERKCEKFNLNNFSTMKCIYEEDLIQNSGIHIYKDSEGWFKFIYETADICTDALDIYAAHSDEP